MIAPSAKAARRQRMERELDKIVRQRALERDGNRCAYSGLAYTLLDPHHVIKRRFDSVRWELDNIVTLSREWHDWAETHPREFLAWFVQRYAARWERIQHLKLQKVRVQDIYEAMKGAT